MKERSEKNTNGRKYSRMHAGFLNKAARLHIWASNPRYSLDYLSILCSMKQIRILLLTLFLECCNGPNRDWHACRPCWIWAIRLGTYVTPLDRFIICRSLAYLAILEKELYISSENLYINWESSLLL